LVFSADWRPATLCCYHLLPWGEPACRSTLSSAKFPAPEISQKSCGVLRSLGPSIQWVESYVTDDKIYCVYIAPNEEMVRQHASQGGFPANRISEVKRKIDPTTSEGR
jgi:hypothetical protein